MFGMYQFPDKETRTLKVATLDELVDNTELGELEAQNWGRALLFHHQWMVLAREHAAALVMLSKEISVVRPLPTLCCCLPSTSAYTVFTAVLVWLVTDLWGGTPCNSGIHKTVQFVLQL